MTGEPIGLEKPKKPKPLWRRILKWVIRVVVTLLVIGAVAWGIFSYVASRDLQNEIAKIQAAGQPLTFAQLEKSQPKVEKTDDAAPFYKAAMDLDISILDDDLTEYATDYKGMFSHASAEVEAKIEKMLSENALMLEMVDSGAQRPGCAYDFGLSNGIGPLIGQLRRPRAVARLLCLRTRWLAHQGKAQAAADSLVSSLRMLRMFDRQPILIVNLVKLACTEMLVDTLPAVLEAGPLSAEQLAKLEQALADVDVPSSLRQMLIVERVYMLEISRNLISPQRGLELGDAPSLPEAAQMPKGFLGGSVHRMMAVKLLQFDQRCIDAAGKDWPEVLEAMREAGRKPGGMFGQFADILVPSFDRAMFARARCLSTLRSAQVAVMAERFRLANCRLPANLDELQRFVGHDLPTDPFTGKALVYRVDPDSFTVYSVGADRTDSGGPTTEPRENGGNDWGVRIALPGASTATSQAR